MLRYGMSVSPVSYVGLSVLMEVTLEGSAVLFQIETQKRTKTTKNTYTYTYKYIYIYIYKEKYMYIYIYIYIG